MKSIFKLLILLVSSSLAWAEQGIQVEMEELDGEQLGQIKEWYLNTLELDKTINTLSPSARGRVNTGSIATYQEKKNFDDGFQKFLIGLKFDEKSFWDEHAQNNRNTPEKINPYAGRMIEECKSWLNLNRKLATNLYHSVTLRTGTVSGNSSGGIWSRINEYSGRNTSAVKEIRYSKYYARLIQGTLQMSLDIFANGLEGIFTSRNPEEGDLKEADCRIENREQLVADMQFFLESTDKILTTEYGSFNLANKEHILYDLSLFEDEEKFDPFGIHQQILGQTLYWGLMGVGLAWSPILTVGISLAFIFWEEDQASMERAGIIERPEPLKFSEINRFGAIEHYGNVKGFVEHFAEIFPTEHNHNITYYPNYMKNMIREMLIQQEETLKFHHEARVEIAKLLEFNNTDVPTLPIKTTNEFLSESGMSSYDFCLTLGKSELTCLQEDLEEYLSKN